MSSLTESGKDVNSGENNPSPVILEMELPPPSEGEKETDKDLERIGKKVNRLQTKINLLIFIGFATPFWLIVLVRYGVQLGHWVWLFTAVLYCPVIIYLIQRICSSFCVTKPLTPAELAYLQENED